LISFPILETTDVRGDFLYMTEKKRGIVILGYTDPKTGFSILEDDCVDVVRMKTEVEHFCEIFILWTGKKGLVPIECLEIEDVTPREAKVLHLDPLSLEIQNLRSIIAAKDKEIASLKEFQKESPIENPKSPYPGPLVKDAPTGGPERPKSPYPTMEGPVNILAPPVAPKGKPKGFSRLWKREDKKEESETSPESQKPVQKQLEEMKLQGEVLQNIVNEQKHIIDKFQIRLTAFGKKEEEYEDQIATLKSGLEKSLELNQDLKKELVLFQKSNKDKIEKTKVEHQKELIKLAKEYDEILANPQGEHVKPKIPQLDKVSLEKEMDDAEGKSVKNLTKKFDQIYKRGSSALEVREFLKEKNITHSFNQVTKKPKSEFEILLSNQEIYQKYLAFLKSQACEENLLFFAQVLDYRANFSKKSKLECWQTCNQMFDTFIKQDSFYEVNIDQSTRATIHKKIGNHDITVDLFDPVFDHVCATMIGDSFLRFRTSKDGAKLISSLQK
jgi:hypothetical protein